LQYILTNEAADGLTGTKIGWYNEYYSTSAELSARVNALAKYISTQSISAINGTKVGLPPASPSNSIYETDAEAFIAAVSTPEAQRLTKKFIQLSDGQTRNAFELDIPESLVQLQT
jgi:enoyl-CoA hydratase/carnithine racemase